MIERALFEPVEDWKPVEEQQDPPALREFLNRLFFRKMLLKPSVANFVRDFGD